MVSSGTRGLIGRSRRSLDRCGRRRSFWLVQDRGGFACCGGKNRKKQACTDKTRGDPSGSPGQQIRRTSGRHQPAHVAATDSQRPSFATLQQHNADERDRKYKVYDQYDLYHDVPTFHSVPDI